MPEGVWTNNWQGVKNALLCGFVRRDWSSVFDAGGNLIQRYQGGLPLTEFSNANSVGSTNPVLVFGTGIRPPAATDRALASKWSSGISRVAVENGELLFDETTHTASRLVKATVQNTGSSPVTVTEWGIAGCGYRNGTCEVLLYRALLDSPVTLQQYESATLSVTVTVQLTDPA